MKHQNVTVQVEAAQPTPPTKPGLQGQPKVTLRGRMIPNPIGRFPHRFALCGNDGTTIALVGVDADEDAWLLGANVEVEGWYDSTAGLEVSRITVVTQ